MWLTAQSPLGSGKRPGLKSLSRPSVDAQHSPRAHLRSHRFLSLHRLQNQPLLAQSPQARPGLGFPRILPWLSVSRGQRSLCSHRMGTSRAWCCMKGRSGTHLCISGHQVKNPKRKRFIDPEVYSSTPRSERQKTAARDSEEAE